MKLTVARQTIVGYRIPDNNKTSPTGKAGFDKLSISRLDP
jgi:hypothetical protein